MKTKKPSLQQILLAAALTLGGCAHAADMAEPDHGPDAAPFAHGGPDKQPDGECGPGEHARGMMRPGHQGMQGPDVSRMGPPMGGMPPFGAMGFMGGEPPVLHGVELSEAQQDKVFAILHAEVPFLREQGKAAAKAHEALRALTESGQYDDAKAAALVQAASQAVSNIALQHVRTDQKLLAVLTPEQRKQVAERQSHHAPRS